MRAPSTTASDFDSCGRFIAAIAIIALSALFAPALAAATPSHHFAGTIDTGNDPVYPFGPCNVWDLDADIEENVYVLCGGSPMLNSYASGTVVKKFDKDGNPVPFTANLPSIQGNTIIENADPNAEYPFGIGEYGRTFSNEGAIAVGYAGPAQGYIFVRYSGRIEVIDPSGRFVAALTPAGLFGIDAIAGAPDGNFYYGSAFKIDKRDISLTVIGQLYGSVDNEEGIYISMARHDLAIDSTGAVWGVGNANRSFPPFTNNLVQRWEADQFGEPEEESTFSLGHHRKAKMSPLVDAPLTGFGAEQPIETDSIAVDRTDDSLYVEQSFPPGIVQFSRGTEEEHSHQITAPIGDNSTVGGGGEGREAAGIASGSGGTIFAGAGSHGVSIFAPGGPLPTLRDHRTAIEDLGHTDATVRAQVELSGGSPITACAVRWGVSREYEQTPVPCEPDPAISNFNSDTPVSAHITGLTTNQTYHFAVVASNADGTAYGIDRTFTPAAVLDVDTKSPTEVTDSSATFNGTVNPDGIPTTYHFQYGLAGDPTDETPESAPISGSGIQQVSVPVTDLGAGKAYQYRLVAKNSLGTTLGPIQTFQIAGPPKVSGVHAENVRSEKADLMARIDPGGYQTTYAFEYGTTTSYGSVASGTAGEGFGNIAVTNHLSGLEAGRVYHFRLVATNKWGTTFSDDTTFNFFPEPCPNEHVRQLMKSSYLPDCRAYELVSPENLEGAQIYPGEEAMIQGIVGGFTKLDPSVVYREIQNTGLANSPSRFAFYVGLGAIAGLDAPNTALDQYTATRTNQGWVTSFSGLKGRETGLSGRKVCSVSLDMCIDHPAHGGFVKARPIVRGALFEVDGDKIGPVPTNWESVEKGDDFHGDFRPSGDLSHVAFSSRDAVFAEGGRTESPGSAYDNDLRTGEVKLISRLNNGQPILGYDEGPYQFITFPPTGVSRDGSHILMSTRAPEGMNRLYLRVNNMITYEIGKGPLLGEAALAKFIGMTPDGSQVLFLSMQSLVSEDGDESADIYAWQENGAGEPTLKLVTPAADQAKADACKASWTEKCSVELLETKAGDRSGVGYYPEAGPYGEMEYQDVVWGGTDSKLARSSGGLFFFSPESFAAGAPRNGKNLYEANNGEIHYVATLGASETIDRIQISPDGIHAGLLTRAQLTGYDNEGFEEMYSYNFASEVLKCVSCLPSGAAPKEDVEASQNGPFMSDDGRLFFATGDPLVPADADPYGIPDVYEYVDGRPQLISSGTSSSARVPGGAGAFQAATLGLESVSADGQDVFFSTTDTLVPQDQNGRFAKIYVARTNGGFDVGQEAAPCVAADECHGPGSSTPAPFQVGTGAGTTGGNVHQAKPQRKKHKSKKRRHKANKRKAHKRKGGHR